MGLSSSRPASEVLETMPAYRQVRRSASRILDVALIVMEEVLSVAKKMCGGLPICRQASTL